MPCPQGAYSTVEETVKKTRKQHTYVILFHGLIRTTKKNEAR